MSQFEINSVGSLHTLCQVQGLNPQYELVEVTGASHCPLFTVEVRLNRRGQRLVAVGQGGSKKLAKEISARNMIKILNDDVSQTTDSGYRHTGSRDMDTQKSLASSSSGDFAIEEKMMQLEILKKEIELEQLRCSSSRNFSTSMSGNVLNEFVTNSDSGSDLPRSRMYDDTRRNAAKVKHDDVENNNVVNTVGQLQELCQRQGMCLPRYNDLGGGPGGINSGQFTVECIFGKDITSGKGPTKKEAKREAAGAMIQKIYNRNENNTKDTSSRSDGNYRGDSGSQRRDNTKDDEHKSDSRYHVGGRRNGIETQSPSIINVSSPRRRSTKDFNSSQKSNFEGSSPKMSIRRTTGSSSLSKSSQLDMNQAGFSLSELRRVRIDEKSPYDWWTRLADISRENGFTVTRVEEQCPKQSHGGKCRCDPRQVLTLVQCSTAPVVVACVDMLETNMSDSYNVDNSIAMSVLQYIKYKTAYSQ